MSTITQALEIHNPAGAVLGIVINHYDGEWIQAVNSADRLTFRCPHEDAAHLVHPNEVWLRRGDDAELVRKFLITVRDDIEGKRAEAQITAYDYSSMLLRASVSEYPTGEEPEDGLVNTADYLTGLVALAADTGITWGTLPVLTPEQETQPYHELHTKSSNVLAALHNVRNNIGGMLWVDNSKKLHWYIERFPAAPSFALELDRNCIEVRKRTDDTTNRTRTEFDVEVVDLSAHDTTDDGMLMIGMPVSVPVPNSSATVTLFVTDIRQRLDNPLALQISVNSVLDTTGRFRDAVDYLLEDMDATNRIDTWIEQIDQGHYETNEWINNADDYETIDEWVASLFGDNIQDVGAANAPGTGTGIAREDHVHKLGAGAFGSSIQDVGTANAAGTGAGAAREDHVHKLGAGAFTDPDAGLIDAIDETITEVLTDPSQELIDALQEIGAITRKAKPHQLNADGNNITCYLWDASTSDWEATTTEVLKPLELRKSAFDGKTITYTDGTSVTYSVSGVDGKYERVADYGGADDEIQAITAPYIVGEDGVLEVRKDGANWVDTNEVGRHWAAEVAEEST